MDQLEILARRFRDAIEATPPNQLPIGLQAFPTGACGDATPLLGHFLKAQGMGAFDYVFGIRDGVTHSWLQQGDVIIDITADQFPEIEAAVMVLAGSTWHASFGGEVMHEANFTIYDADTKATLGAAYGTIVRHMEGLV